jgi:ABC-2 type transport system permease protein
MLPFSKKNRVLLGMLVKTDFKLRYQDSVLGIAWSLLNPLMLFAIMYVVFDKFFGMGRMEGVEHYPVQLLLGIIMWTFFAEATQTGMGSIVAHGGLLRKISFPKFVVVMTSTLSALINLLLSLVVVLVFAIFNHVEFTWRVLLFPLSIVEMYIFALGFAFFLSAFYVKFRDIGHIWSVILQGWFYATPIIYPLAMVTNFSPLASKIVLLFPPAQAIQDARYALISQKVPTVWNYINSFGYQCIPLLVILLICTLGFWYFRKSSKTFAEEI